MHFTANAAVGVSSNKAQVRPDRWVETYSRSDVLVFTRSAILYLANELESSFIFCRTPVQLKPGLNFLLPHMGHAVIKCFQGSSAMNCELLTSRFNSSI